VTTRVVLFGIGSPLLPDVEESLHRGGILIAAGVKNHPAPDHLAPDTPRYSPEDLPPRLRELPFLVPIFTPAWRQTAAREAAALGFRHPFTLIDPTTPVPRALDAQPGAFVNAGCVIGAGAILGLFALVNRGASVGHHVILGAFASIGPSAVIAGEAVLGSGCVIGAGAVVLPRVTIGENAVVGAGAVVTRDVPPGCLAVGNPARIARRDIGGYHGVAVA
jgi:sugar O-acyltransferase (sialic acid O-acetyltransferase NeuD family)